MRVPADWGTSEWPAQMIQEARDHANRLGLVPPFFDQSHYNMLHRDREAFISLRKSSLENAWRMLTLLCCVVIRRGD